MFGKFTMVFVVRTVKVTVANSRNQRFWRHWMAWAISIIFNDSIHIHYIVNYIHYSELLLIRVCPATTLFSWDGPICPILQYWGTKPISKYSSSWIIITYVYIYIDIHIYIYTPHSSMCVYTYVYYTVYIHIYILSYYI